MFSGLLLGENVYFHNWGGFLYIYGFILFLTEIMKIWNWIKSIPTHMVSHISLEGFIFVLVS